MRSLSAVSSGIDDALGEAVEVPLSCYGPTDLLGYVTDLHRARARLDGLIAGALVAADQAGVAGQAGQRSLPAAVAAAGTLDPKAIGRDLALGRWLAHFDLIAGAFRCGRLTRRHVEVLRGADTPRTRTHLREGQEHLIEAAETCAFVDFTQVVAEWTMRADPDGEEPDEREKQRRCSVHKNADGSVTGSFRFATIAGDAFINALEREYQRLLAEDRTSTDPERLLRTETQRRADALVNLVTRGVGRTDASVPAPLVHLVLGWSVAEDLLRPEPGEVVPTDRHDVHRRCELADGTPVHPTEAARLLAVAELRRLVLGAKSETLDLGRTVRNFPRKFKQALTASSRGRCQYPGCDAKVSWLEVDHIDPWSLGGPTDMANAQVLCGCHNRQKGNQPAHTNTEPTPEPGHDPGCDSGPDPGPDP